MPGDMEEFYKSIDKSDWKPIVAQDFSDVKPGDKVTRLLAEVVVHECKVEKVDDDYIYVFGGWKFERSTGFERDEDLLFGSEWGHTGSRLIRSGSE